MASRDTVRSWVYGIINVFPSFLSSPARFVADRVFGVWDEISGFLAGMLGPFRYITERAYRYVNAFWRFVNEASVTVRWIVTLFVPRWARWALNLALDTLRTELSSAWSRLQTIVTDVRNFLQRLINEASAWAQGWITWLRDRLAETIATLTAVRDRVVQLLTAPEVFVDWVFAALWRKFWRFANDHAEAIAAAYWPRRDDLLLRTLARIETFLMRVL